MKTVKYLGMTAMLVFFTWIQTTALQAGRKYSFDFEYPFDRPPAHDLKINVFYYKNQVVDGDRSGTISITSRNGNTSTDSLWNGGEGVDGEGWYNDVENSDNLGFDMEGQPPVQPGQTIGLEIQLDGKEVPFFITVAWTDINGYVVCDRMILRNVWGTRWLLGEWNIPSGVKNFEGLQVSPRPADNNVVAACHLPDKDTVDFSLYPALFQNGIIIDLGVIHGTVMPGEGAEVIFETPGAENGDTLHLVWEYTNRASGEQFYNEINQVIEKGGLFTQGDIKYWSVGEEPVTGIYYLGGEGVEVTCEEIPGFSASNPEPEYISAAVIIPPEFENSEWFELTFIRQGPPQPGSKSYYKGLLVETASLTVRHANFQPAISWTSGEGSFEPDEGVVYFPITITREAEDEDWANIEIFSEQLADTSYFHKRITGNQADIELPLEMDQSIWDQVDNLTIKIS